MSKSSAAQSISIEDKLKRLKDIQTMLENKSVNLTESMKLLEEAYTLKIDVEKELKSMENKLIDLSKTELQN